MDMRKEEIMGILFPSAQSVLSFHEWVNPSSPLTTEGLADRIRFVLQKMTSTIANPFDIDVLQRELDLLYARKT